MPQASADLVSSPCLQFKGSMVPLTTLELLNFESTAFSQALADKVAQAPNLFANLPLVLSLEKYDGDVTELDFQELRELCAQQNLQLVGARVTAPDHIEAATRAGLAVLQPSRLERAAPSPSDIAAEETTGAELDATHQDNRQEPSHTEDFRAEQAVNPPDGSTHNDSGVTAEATVASPETRVIRTPVRSGQQIYAPGGDLIVLAPVSAGAEILADGNIHVYAPLRGRALAGVRGSTNASIFCYSLEAELVSIAGQYKLSDDLQGALWKKPVRVCLRDERLEITPMDSSR